MRRLLPLGALASFAIALAGCGDPAPSTAIAPDRPTASGKDAGPSDLSKIKEAEHRDASADRQNSR